MLKVELRFIAIVSLDIYKKSQCEEWGVEYIGRITRRKPDCIKGKKWEVTEEDAEDEYVKYHRKYVGHMLTFAEIKELAEYFYSTCQTMGSLTLEYGHLSSISWNVDDAAGYSLNAYISPIVYNAEEFNKAIESYEEDHIKAVMERDCWPRLEEAEEMLEDLDFINDNDFDDLDELEIVQEGGTHEKFRWLVDDCKCDVHFEQLMLNFKEIGDGE